MAHIGALERRSTRPVGKLEGCGNELARSPSHVIAACRVLEERMDRREGVDDRVEQLRVA